jgi:hypothetical protein
MGSLNHRTGGHEDGLSLSGGFSHGDSLLHMCMVGVVSVEYIDDDRVFTCRGPQHASSADFVNHRTGWYDVNALADNKFVGSKKACMKGHWPEVERKPVHVNILMFVRSHSSPGFPWLGGLSFAVQSSSCSNRSHRLLRTAATSACNLVLSGKTGKDELFLHACFANTTCSGQWAISQ